MTVDFESYKIPIGSTNYPQLFDDFMDAMENAFNDILDGTEITGELTVENAIVAGGHIYKNVNDGNLVVSGGSAGNAGANISLYGQAHDTLKHQIEIRNGTVDILVFNNANGVAGTGQWEFKTEVEFDADIILGSSIVNADNNGAITISGGSSSGIGGNLVLYGSGNANKGDILFRNAGDELLTWDETADKWVFQKPVQIEDNLTVNGSIWSPADSGSITISGSTADRAGANILLYGEGHTNKGDMVFYNGSDPLLTWDETADDWVFQKNVVLEGDLNSDGTYGPALINATGFSSTVPTILPSQNDTQSGFAMASVDDLAVITNGVERLRVNNNRVLSRVELVAENNLHVESAGANEIIFHREDLSIVNNNPLGAFEFWGDDPSTNLIGARIAVSAAGDWTSSSNGAKIIFSLDNALTLTEEFRIETDTVTVANNLVVDGQISLASNLLGVNNTASLGMSAETEMSLGSNMTLYSSGHGTKKYNIEFENANSELLIFNNEGNATPAYGQWEFKRPAIFESLIGAEGLQEFSSVPIGAANGDLWVTLGHADLPDGVVMRK